MCSRCRPPNKNGFTLTYIVNAKTNSFPLHRIYMERRDVFRSVFVRCLIFHPSIFRLHCLRTDVSSLTKLIDKYIQSLVYTQKFRNVRSTWNEALPFVFNVIETISRISWPCMSAIFYKVFDSFQSIARNIRVKVRRKM